MTKALLTIDQLLSHALERICALSDAHGLIKESALDFNMKYTVEVTHLSNRLMKLTSTDRLCLDATLVQGVLHSSNEDASTVLAFCSQNWLESFGLRFVSDTAPVSHTRLISGNLKEEEWPLVTEAIERYRHHPIYFVQGVQSIEAIRQIAPRTFSKASKVKSIVIDLQCLTEWRQQFQEQLFIGENYVAQLENLSRDLDCSVVMIDVGPS